jgi:serine/threonine protein kinase
MTAGASKDAQLPPREEEAGSASEGLVTSEDLFGDLVDAPLEPAPRTATGHAGPIRVQVAEPGPPEPRKGHGAPPAITEATEEEVAALLDAFGGAPAAELTPVSQARATQPVAVQPPAAKPAPAARIAEAAATPPEPIRPPAPKAPVAEEHLEALLESLGPGQLRPQWKPAPKGVPELPVPGGALPRRPEMPSAVPNAAPHAAPAPEAPADGPFSEAAKFSAAAAPRTAASAGDRPALDLAALAEDALSAAPTEALLKPPAAEQAYGPYSLLERIAVGGMAEVFKAKRTGVEGFEKVLAVKRILPHLSDNKEFVEMFIDEAKMVAGLTHPSIVQIYDLGKIDRSYYIAMEYVHGRDLRSIVKRVKDKGLRLPMDLAALIAQRVCAALEYAHRKKDERGRAMRIVHRDVSPQNILISFEGEVKLTDFGIAKAATKASQTERGALRGKLLYMSPEQAWGKPMDRRSDLFSLGIVLYEMLTERQPFLGQSEIGILEAVRECRVAPPRSSNPRIPERLEAVVLRTLEREPDHRYQDAGELARDLERALPDRKPPASAELARFMEILFDQDERREAAEAGHTSGKHKVARRLEVDLPAAPAPRPVAKELSIDKLLERFGIK